MGDENKIPVMLEFLFGEAAERAQRGASRRLRRWCRAFDDWLKERQSRYGQATHKQARLAWRRLLRQQHKMPWELSKADIEEHARRLQEEGYAAATIANAIGIIGNFYRWCEEQQVDPACGVGFNPAAGAQRPKIRRYAGAKLLSRGEVQALPDALQSDATPLGKLPRLPEEEGETGEREVAPPRRTGKPFKPGEGMRHGLYARSQPLREVEEILAEGRRGLDEEFEGLRMLARGLLNRQAEAASRTEETDLMAAYTRAAHWLGELRKAEELLQRPEQEDEWVEQTLEALSNAFERLGEEVGVERLRAEALGEDPEMGGARRQLSEEIASTRLVLRRTIRLASETQDAREQVRLTDLYGSGCMRLAKLLKAGRGETGRIKAYLDRTRREAIRDAMKELGLGAEQ
jgi:hypothetical protein